MKKSELKNIIKPLVKECINEVLLQEGVLSSVIAEVVAGLNTNIVREVRAPDAGNNLTASQERAKLDETRKRMLDAIGKDSYKGVNVFEGTSPAPAAPSKGDPMANIDPRDPGVDISSIFGAQMATNWGKIARGSK